MAAEILIVDDDPLVGGLSLDILTDAGYVTKLIRDSQIAMSAIKEHRPRLAILDILMPGIDGLTLLHAIKHDEALKDIKVCVVSGKSFSAEIQRAKEYGAELFIQKPYDIKVFAKQVGDLIGPPRNKPEEAKAEPKTAVQVKVWGDSEPASTPVVSIESLGQLFILDAGNGIVPLGEHIIQEGRHKRAWLLLSHFHPDHVCALGLCPLLRQEGFELHIAGPREPAKDLSAVLREAIQQSFSKDSRPVTARIKLHELREQTYEVQEGLRIAPFYANHPSSTLGFHLELAGRRIILSPDAEIYGEEATALQDYDEKTGRIVRKADLMLHDARYKDLDYETHKNEGHSSISNTVGFAADNEIERLVLFHLDHSYSPDDLKDLETEARRLLEEKGAMIPCWVAKNGLTVDI